MNAPDRSILLIEDNQEDFEATLRALKTNGITVPVFRCDNGDDGLDFIYQRGVFANPLLAPRPSIILLDLNLPGTDGREVLSSVKNDELLKTVPIVVLTTSADPRDIEQCYYMGANSFITKAVNFNDFSRTIQQLHDYWFELVALPLE